MRNTWDERYFRDDRHSLQWRLAKEKLDLLALEFIYKVYGTSPVRHHELFNELISWFDDLKDNYPKLSPRVMLQTLGTEWGRDHVHEDVWVDYMIRRTALIVEQGFKGTVVSDVRFKNELLAIRKAGGKLVKVVRPATDTAALVTGVENHQSESEQKLFTDDQFDHVVLNKGSLEDLYSEVDKISQYLTSE
jgi:hypothetical protein